MLLKVVTSVPSSGRPICETHWVTSGEAAKTVRSWSASFAGGVEGDVLRHRCANPEVALFERRHELAADEHEGKGTPTASRTAATIQTRRGKLEGELQGLLVTVFEVAAEPVYPSPTFCSVGAEMKPRTGAKRKQTAARPSERSHSAGHGREDLSRDALHGEERNEGDQNDERGEDNRPCAIGDAGDDQVAGLLSGDVGGEVCDRRFRA